MSTRKPWADLWRDHSLSLTLAALGGLLMLPCIPLAPGEAWDLLMTLGGGCWTVGLVNVLSGPLRERNRPEE